MGAYKGKPFWSEANCPPEQRQIRKWKSKLTKAPTPRPKKDLWGWIRRVVLRRDRFRCQYCGRSGDWALLQVDHIIPVSRGGSNKLRNLITACQPCNTKKSAKMPSKKHRKDMDRKVMANLHAADERERLAQKEARELEEMFADKMASDE